MPFLSCFFILLISSAYIFKNKNRDNYKSEGCFEASKITNKIPAKYVVKSVCFPRRRKKCIFFESYSDFPCTVLRKKGECVTFHLSIIRWKMHHYYTAEEGVCRIASRAILPGAMERMPRESSSSQRWEPMNPPPPVTRIVCFCMGICLSGLDAVPCGQRPFWVEVVFEDVEDFVEVDFVEVEVFALATPIFA